MAEETGRALMRAVFALLLAAGISAAIGAEPSRKGPAWAELTVEQQQILAPLKTNWESLDSENRRRWVGIAKRYPSMQPKEQERVVQRMDKWAKLAPEQRRAARERYRSLGKLPPEKRQDLRQQWAEYQALPPPEQRKFDTPPSATSSRDKRKPRTASKPPKPQTTPVTP